MMQLMQMNSSPAQSQAPALENRESAKEVSKEAAEFAAMVQGAQSLVNVPVAVENSQSPETRQVAASMNTAALIAGQQPWSKGWVFQGGDQSPTLSPLIGNALGSDPEALKNQLEAAQKNAPQSLVDLLSSNSPELEKVGMEMLESSLRLQPGQSVDSMQGEVPMIDALSDDFSERRGLEAGGNASSKSGMPSFANQSDAGSVPAKVMARPQLVSGAEFLSMKDGMKQGMAGKGVIDSKTERLRDEILAGPSLGGGSSESAGFPLLQASGPSSAQSMNIPLKLEVNGNTTTGGAMQNRLTSESVMGMSQSLMRLGAQGGGEIRLKLKPDALGEVRIGVISHGNSVSLQIHARDENAKRIVEESLGSLKDALASHSLTLGKVDLQVSAQPVLASNSQLGAEMEQGNRQSGQGGFGAFEGQRDSRGQSESGGQPSRERLGLAVARAQAFSPTRAVGAEGRLDVRA